ncbi:hypothetical protein [Arenimonas sp.]|uniref:hypothetical protein n=1 Tax=Arenimonas sp. TaxID=1872635 RepID=UPI0035B4458D
MNIDRHLRRGLYALPLLAVGLLAMSLPPPRLGEVVDRVVSAGLGCDPAGHQAGPLGLVRMPGDLGVLTRRLNCAS